MTPKIFDFSEGKIPAPSVIVISPNYRIQERKVEIKFMASPVPMFRINVGCQSATVTADNVDQMIAELEGQELPTQPLTVIVGNDKAPNSDSPVLREEAGNYFISTGLRAYPKENSKLVVRNIKPENKFFKRSQYRKTNFTHIPSNYDIYGQEVEKLLTILRTAKSFFAQNA